MKKALFNLVLLLNLSLLPFFSITNARFYDKEIGYIPTLTASSLDFELLDEIGSPITDLFKEKWLTLDTPVEQRVVVKNIGSESFLYYPAFVYKSGENEVCKSLRLTANREGAYVYSGQLDEFDIPALATELTENEDLWIFTIENSNESLSLQGQFCEFEIEFATIGSGFSDKETLNSSVTLAYRPTLSASYNSSNHTFSLTMGNLSTFTKFTYSIDYSFIFEDTEVVDHFEDTIMLTGESDKTIEKLLGTCSDSCSYQDDPHDFTVEIEFEHSDGYSVILTKEI